MSFQPQNYRLSGVDPILQASRGFQFGSGIRDKMKENDLAQMALQRKQEMQQDLVNFSTGPKSLSDYDNLFAKYPSLQAKLKAPYERATEVQKQGVVNRLQPIFGSLKTGNTEYAKALIDQGLEAAKNSGDAQSLRQYQQWKSHIEENPEIAKGTIGMVLKQVMEDEDFERMIEPTEKESYRVLTNKEKKELGLDEDIPAQVSTSGKISTIGGKGMTINVGDDGLLPKPPEGFRYKKDAEGNIEQVVIPGSKQAKELEEMGKKGAKKELKKAEQEIIVTDSIDDALKLIEGHSVLQPVAGVAAEVIPKKYNQPYQNMTSKLNTIAASISFKTLMEMKEASRTGSALGAISERELILLQSTLGALDQKQDPQQLKKSLETIKKILNKHNDYMSRKSERAKENIEAIGKQEAKTKLDIDAFNAAMQQYGE